jgi:uncharacterized membrane protein YgdD (TMEM256/DUF423 family)
MGLGSIFGSTAIVGGAFGAHALSFLPAERLSTLKTATQYQLIHAVVLLVIASLMGGATSRSIRTAVFCIAVGTFLFSTSLSCVAVLDWHWAGAIAPFGGTLLIVGWISLFFCHPKSSEASN